METPIERPRPKVGLGVVIVKNSKILTGIRIGSHCPGQRCVPGGHLEFGEGIWKGCEREVAEEAGKDLVIRMRPFDEARIEWLVVNNVLEGNKHYVGLFMVADWLAGEPRNMEPHKNKGWEWTDYDEIVRQSKPGCAWLPEEMFVIYRNRILKLS